MCARGLVRGVDGPGRDRGSGREGDARGVGGGPGRVVVVCGRVVRSHGEAGAFVAAVERVVPGHDVRFSWMKMSGVCSTRVCGLSGDARARSSLSTRRRDRTPRSSAPGRRPVSWGPSAGAARTSPAADGSAAVSEVSALEAAREKKESPCQ